MSGDKLDYSSSGVNINEGNLFVEKIKALVSRTMDANVPENIGGFAGFYNIGFAKDMADPVLVSSTDGVGTKLKLAFMMNRYDTVGIDLVAMCVNDIIVTGAKPIFFLDYIATGKLRADKMVDVVKGITDGCVDAGVALLGGETAEMPGMYAEDEFDLAGFCVGIVDKKNIINGETIQKGDLLVGIKSSGLHSNGFSLSFFSSRSSEASNSSNPANISSIFSDSVSPRDSSFVTFDSDSTDSSRSILISVSSKILTSEDSFLKSSNPTSSLIFDISSSTAASFSSGRGTTISSIPDSGRNLSNFSSRDWELKGLKRKSSLPYSESFDSSKLSKAPTRRITLAP